MKQIMSKFTLFLLIGMDFSPCRKTYAYKNVKQNFKLMNKECV